MVLFLDAAKESDGEKMTSEKLGNFRRYSPQAPENEVRGTGEGELLLLQASQCHLSDLPNRVEESFSDVDFEQLKVSIQAHGGNEVPGKVVREILPDGTERYLVVWGARRYRACAELELPFCAVVVDRFDETSALEAMIIENAHRKPMSAWEQGRQYAALLKLSPGLSQAGLAKKLRRDAAEVSRALAVYRLPAEVVAAFPSPKDIKAHWVENLNRALEVNKNSVFWRAEKIREEGAKRTPRAVLNQLTTSVETLNTSSERKELEQVSRRPLRWPLFFQEREIGSASRGEDGTVRLTLAIILDDGALSLLVDALQQALEQNWTAMSR